MHLARLSPNVVAVAIACGGASFAPRANAEDPKKDDITVIPLNAALLKVSSSDNKFAPSFITPFLGPGIQLALSASVPLDEKTRTAPFLENNNLLPGFRSTLALTWTSAYMELGDGPDPIEQVEYCQTFNIDPCLASSVKKHKRGIATWQTMTSSPSETWGSNHSPIFIVGAESTLAYDSIKARPLEDVSQPRQTMKKHHIELGLTVHIWKTWQKSGTIAFSIRGGGANTNTIATRNFRLCEDLQSSTPDITGEVCEDSTVVVKQTAASWSGYARASLLYLGTTPVASSYLPGIEVRLNFEQLGSDFAYLNPRLLGFLSPRVSESLRARVGVGVETRTPFGSPGETDVIPLGVAGLSF